MRCICFRGNLCLNILGNPQRHGEKICFCEPASEFFWITKKMVLGCKNFRVQTNLLSKIFELKVNMGTKKIWGPRKFRVPKYLGPDKIWGSKKFRVKDTWGQKKIGTDKKCSELKSVRRNLGPTNYWSKKYWAQKSFGSNKFLVQKILGSKKFLGQKY